MTDVLALPDDHWLRRAHARSIFHRAEIEASAHCGCFYCRRIFSATEIADWTDEKEPKDQQTALCPYCGIDSVIGDASGFEITDAFLKAMNAAWF